MPWRSPDTWAWRLPVLQLIALLAAAAYACTFQWRLAHLHVPDEDYAAVAAVLEREARPGDAVLLYPWWTERARLFVPASLPVVGHIHSDDEPLEDSPRVWLLSAPELPRADLPAFERAHMAQRERQGEARRFGKLALSAWKNGLYRPARFSGADALSVATAYVEGPDGSRTPCSWNGHSHDCPGGAGASTGWHEVDQVPRRCLSLRPPGGSARLVLDWPSVPSQPGDQVQLEGGITWEYVARVAPELGDVMVTVQGNGRTLATLRAPQGVETFHRASGDAPASAGPLSLAISAPGAHDRDSCIGLFIRAGRAP